MKQTIYLDHNAATPIDPRVLIKMTQSLTDEYGNPSSVHAIGKKASYSLMQSRDHIAEFFVVKPQEIVFTSSATEAINMVMRGALPLKKRGHLITSSAEHAAVYSMAKQLESEGHAVTYLNPGLWGAVTPEAVLNAIRPETHLIALMAVNNETGVKTDIEGIARHAADRGIPLFVDGVALLGKEVFSIPKGVSAMCFSGYKVHGPKGIGLLFLRNTFKISPLIVGGPQENRRRGGTENLPGIVGMAEAIRCIDQELPTASLHMEKLRNRLEQGIIERVPNVQINGQGPRTVNTTNLCFTGIDGETLLMALDLKGVAVSHGSACSSGALEPSRILLNMGLSVAAARSSLRFSLSRMTTEVEIEAAIEIVSAVANHHAS